MIIDKIENIKFYSNISEKISKALTFLKNTKFIDQQNGKYQIEDNDLFYIVQRYQTKPLAEGKFEAHKKYIDIQYLVSGKEIIGYAPLVNLAIIEPYNDKTDVAFYKAPENFTTLLLTPGSFAIFFPHDAHLPCRQLNTPEDVLKVVVKVKH
jgi:biofilm protein TabA